MGRWAAVLQGMAQASARDGSPCPWPARSGWGPAEPRQPSARRSQSSGGGAKRGERPGEGQRRRLGAAFERCERRRTRWVDWVPLDMRLGLLFLALPSTKSGAHARLECWRLGTTGGWSARSWVSRRWRAPTGGPPSLTTALPPHLCGALLGRLPRLGSLLLGGTHRLGDALADGLLLLSHG